MLELFVQQHPIGQPGERIVHRHVRDLRLRPALLGDVLMGGDGATVRHGPRRNGNAASVVELGDVLRRPFPRHATQCCAQQILDAASGAVACRDAILQDLPKRRAGPHLIGREPVHQSVLLVGDDEPLFGVEHRQALDHVAKRRIEPQVLLPQLFFLLLQQPMLRSSCAISFCRSVTSSCVTSRPPLAMPWRVTLMMRPSASS